MLTGRDIIVFGDDWGRYPSTIQHIGRILAKDNRLLWIGSLGLRKPKLGLHDVLRVWEKGKRIFQKGAAAATNPHVREIAPFILPFHDSRAVRRFNNRQIRTLLLSIMKELDVHDPILVTANPVMAELVGTLNESSSHYICLDDFTLFDGAFDCIWPLEQKLLANVDSCFSVSESLLQTRKPFSGNNFFLPQGVNTEHFSAEGPIVEQITRIHKPVIGFFGLLTSWIDLQLIVESARAFPDASFVVLGRTTVDVTSLGQQPNIYYWGEVPFSELPRYARGFNVGLIPFLVNDLTVAANPLKLMEYLSIGMPVVSTALPEVEKFSRHVFVARNNAEFVSMIGKAIEDCAPEKNLERRALALPYSWQAITESMSIEIMKIEQEKKI